MDKSNRKKKIYQVGGGEVSTHFKLQNSELHYTMQDSSVKGFFDLKQNFCRRVQVEDDKIRFACTVSVDGARLKNKRYLGIGDIKCSSHAVAKSLKDKINPREMSKDEIKQIISGGKDFDMRKVLLNSTSDIIHTTFYSQIIGFLLSMIGEHEIGEVICGNALRPAGSVGKPNGTGLHDVDYERTPEGVVEIKRYLEFPFNHGTQEENVTESWIHGFIIMNDLDPAYFEQILHHEFRQKLGIDNDLMHIFPQNLQDEITRFYQSRNGMQKGQPFGAVYPNAKLVVHPMDYIKYSTDHAKWEELLQQMSQRTDGVKDLIKDLYSGKLKCSDEDSDRMITLGLSEDEQNAIKNKMATLSIPGFDYTEPFPKTEQEIDEYAMRYRFTHTLKKENVALPANYYLYKGVSCCRNSVFKADIVYCYGPNIAYNSRWDSLYGTAARSRIPFSSLEENYPAFRACVKAAYQGALETMLSPPGIKFPILSFISGGIYATETLKPRIRNETPDIITEVLADLRGKGISLPQGGKIFLCDSRVAKESGNFFCNP